jgi:multidrug transporter EmrE-like cation transporter
MAGNRLPNWNILLRAMILGSISYGLSITLFIRAMRGLGAARTSALFGIAPFAGVVLSFLLFHETVIVMFLVAIPLMIVGALFLVSERHDHKHIHEEIRHEHCHTHDDKHHVHEHGEINSRSHSHVHEHPCCEHEHHHMPDIHHRHAHS